MIKRIKSNRGEGFVHVLVVFFVVLLLFAVFLEYALALTVANSVKDSINRAVMNLASDNAVNAYTGFREGISSTEYYIDVDDFISIVEGGAFYSNLQEELNVSRDTNGDWIAYNGNNQIAYIIADLDVNADNYDNRNRSNDDTLKFTTQATVKVPIRLLNSNFFAEFDLTLESYWSPKFNTSNP